MDGALEAGRVEAADGEGGGYGASEARVGDGASREAGADPSWKESGG